MNRLYILFPFFLLILIVCGCNSNEIGNAKDVNPERIYFDYRISGEDGSDSVTIILQFRFGGPNGTTLVLQEPSQVELDGVKLIVDSSKMTGAFYETFKSVREFTGEHEIVYTDINQKKYREPFSFHPVTLKAEIPAEIERGDLLFELDGLERLDFVRTLMTDTSFESDGINRLDSVRDGRIVITRKELRNLVNGLIQLDFYKENEKPVKNGTEEGGRISISYGIKRSFLLKKGQEPE
ncbi:MAG TPA: hypothetical protein VLJ68_03085 [Chitinophagaceae bacterium]|nr:hypothetical protein [Chitinophagaceae bacterium]